MKPARLAVPLAAGALLVAGCGGTDAVTGQNAAAAQVPGQGGGFGGGPNTAALAKALGVSQSKLQSAMQSLRPSGAGPTGNGGPPGGTQGGAPPSGGAPPTGGPPGGFGNGTFTKQLAKKLGLSEAKVQQAFQSVAPQGAPQTQTGSGTNS